MKYLEIETQDSYQHLTEIVQATLQVHLLKLKMAHNAI